MLSGPFLTATLSTWPSFTGITGYFYFTTAEKRLFYFG